MNLILGSSSKHRKAVLENNGFTFTTISPDIDEKAIRTDDYYQLPLLIARAKADAILPKISDEALVITSDQVVVCDGNLYEKPENKEEAESFLKKYGAGYPAETVSAVVVTNTKNGKRAEGIDIAKVYYNVIPADVIEKFIETGDPFSNAGGFAIQSPLLQPYQKEIEGTKDSVMGMPLQLLSRLMKEVGG